MSQRFLLSLIVLFLVFTQTTWGATAPKPASKIRILPVPFTSQAPYAKWDSTHQEACEEASMLMVAEYVKKTKGVVLSPEYAEAEILKLIDWETKYLFAQDVTAAETVKILQDYYNISATVVPYSAARIKQEIDASRPVIIPAAGRLLKNPYFRRPGPLYHMLVIVGYDGDEFIVNDPGTKRGQWFRYKEKILSRAVHDWNGGQVEKGERVMIVFQKQNSNPKQ